MRGLPDCGSGPAGDASRLFPPRSVSEARTWLQDHLAEDPHAWGVDRARWTVATVGTMCPWLETTSPSGTWRVLQRLGLRYVRARGHIRSPDPDYDAKLAALEEHQTGVAAALERQVLLYQDEVTLYRNPTVAPAWVAQGRQPRAQRSPRSQTRTRIAAVLDATTGQVHYRRGSHVGVGELVRFYQTLCAAYPQAERIYLVQDNTPFHFHPDLLVALEPQQTPFARPSLAWPTTPSAEAVRRWGDLHLPIQLVPLPTYASWLNPIEKLWRWLRQDVIHLHRLVDDLETLRGQIDAFLDRFAQPSPNLLHYVGLNPSD